MEKTTVYLPRPLKQALKRAAEAAGTSEATVIRNAIERATIEQPPPRPRLPLFRSSVPDLAEQVDEALAGAGAPPFGER